jgi:hypothetical protein
MNILLGVGQGGGETPSCQRIPSLFKYAGFKQSLFFITRNSNTKKSVRTPIGVFLSGDPPAENNIVL